MNKKTAMNIKKLIEEVITDLGNNRSLDDIASKVQIIARLLKNDDFQDWVSKEFLDGYRSDEKLPEYRISSAAGIKATYMVPQGLGALHVSNAEIPMMNLGREKYDEVMKVRLLDAIPAIQKYAENVEHLSMSLSSYEKCLVQQVLGEAQIMNCHKELSPSSFLVPIEKVRAKLIDMFIDFDESLFDNTIDFNAINQKTEISRIVNNYISNSGIYNAGTGSVAVNDSIVAQGENISVVNDGVKTVLDLLYKVEDLCSQTQADKTEIQETLNQMREELKSPQPRKGLLKMGFNALLGLGKAAALTGVEEIVKEGVQALNCFK